MNTRTLLSLATAGLAGGLAARYLHRQRYHMDFQGASVVISGGSRGLGLELARRFAQEGASLTLLARDEDDLEEAHRDLAQWDAEVLTVACDVRELQEVRRAVDAIADRFGTIDVLVNNAGVIQAGPLEHMTREDFEEAMDVHLWGPLYLTQEVLPFMRKQNGGRIVNITSIGGLVAVPHLLPYTTSKFALVGLSDGLRAELAKDGIFVTTVAPGLMRTGSHVNAFFKGQHEMEFTWFSLSNAFPLASTTSAHAARRIVEACRYGQSHLTITLPARLLHLADTLFPNLTAAAMKVANRLLPGPDETDGEELQTGWESTSALAPSALTHPSDKMIDRNNEGLQ